MSDDWNDLELANRERVDPVMRVILAELASADLDVAEACACLSIAFGERLAAEAWMTPEKAEELIEAAGEEMSLRFLAVRLLREVGVG